MQKLMIAGALAAAALFTPPAVRAQATKEARPATAAGAQDAPNQGATGGDAAAFSDELFAQAAAASGLAEIAVSNIALKNGTDESKKHAQQMIDDHTRANQQLMALAQAKRVALPRTVSIQDAAAAAALAGLKGEDFDREFMKQQHAAHICSVQLFTTEAERGQDPDMKALAAKTLPTLKEHLKMFKDACEKHEKHEKSSQ